MSKAVRVAGLVVGMALAVGIGVAGLLLTSPSSDPSAAGESTQAYASPPIELRRPIVSAAGLVDKSGVRVVRVSVSGGGGLIDLRFQVVDPDKADAVHAEATPPVLVDETTGVVVHDLLMGHQHTDGFKAGVTYYLIFENPGNLVLSGTTVSVLLGNAQVEHVVVR